MVGAVVLGPPRFTREAKSHVYNQGFMGQAVLRCSSSALSGERALRRQMSEQHRCGRSVPILRLAVMAVFAFGLATTSPSAQELDLELERELGRLQPADSKENVSEFLPMLLGVTNISHRIQEAEHEAAGWQIANQVLESHLEARERHLTDLRVFVDRQNGAIDALEKKAANMQRLVSQPKPVAAVTALTVEAAADDLYGVPLGSPYLAGGLLGVIAVLLAWTLGLRSRLNRGRAAYAD